MYVELVNSMEAVRGLLPQWRRFQERAAEGKTLFNDPDYVLLQLESDPALEPHLLIVRNDEKEICCVAPFYLSATRFAIKLSVITLWQPPAIILKIFGDDFVVAAEQDSESCFQVVFDFLKGECASFSAIYFDKLNTGSRLWVYCTDKCRLFHAYLASAAIEKVHRIRLPASHDAYMAQISSATRSMLRRQTKKLCTEKQVRLEKFTTPAEVPGLLHSLDAVYRDSWQAKTFGYRTRNTEREQQLLTRIAELGWLRSYLLMTDSKPLAFELSYQHDGVLHLMDCGFSQDWADYGPGTVLLHMCIEDVIQDNPAKVLDFGFGDASYKRSLANESYEAGSLYLVARRRWRALMSAQRALFAVEGVVRRVAIKLKVDRILRKLVKRQQ